MATGTNNTDQLEMPVDGAVHVARWTSDLTFPANESASLDPAFTTVGWIGEDAPKIKVGRQLIDIRAWQRRAPILRRLKQWDVGVVFDCLEVAGNTLDLAFGGLDIEETSTGHWELTPTGAPAEFAVILDMHSDDSIYRFLFFKGSIVDSFDLDMPRDEAVKLRINFNLLELEDSVDPFKIQTNDPAADPENSEGS